MPTSLALLRIHVDEQDARDLVAILAAIADTVPPPICTEDATVTVGGTEIVVLPGGPAAPIEIEVSTDRDLAEVLDDVIAAHGSASSAPSDPDAPIESVTAHVGDVTVRVALDVALVPFLMERLGRAEIAGETVEAAFWRGSLRHVRKVQGEITRIQEQVLALIPARERGAISALAIEEATARMQAAVIAAAAEAKKVSAEILEEDQRRREADRG